MLYGYQGLNADGKNCSGSLDAVGLKEARSRLKANGIYVTSINEERVKDGKGLFSFALFERSVPQKEMTSFFRQTASLLTAGITLMETLDATQKQTGSKLLKKVINELKSEVRQGEPIAKAMEKHPAIFDTLTTAMVRAGETGGNLAEVLTKIADYKETALRRESEIQSATVYPVVMAVIGIGVIIFLVVYIVPKITVIFEDLEQALPLSTTILIAVTNIAVNYGYVIGVALVAALLALGRFLKTEKGKRLFDKVSLRTPLAGPLVKASVLARWSHTTSVLLASGVPLLNSLKLSKEIAGNALYADAIGEAAETIREGGAITASLEKSGLFPPVALQMISAGEKSGQSAQLLAQVAKDQSAELENRIAVLMSLIQPALITSMGLIVGFIVMAILLPIFEISQFIG